MVIYLYTQHSCTLFYILHCRPNHFHHNFSIFLIDFRCLRFPLPFLLRSLHSRSLHYFLRKFNSYFFLQIQLLASQSYYNSNFQSFLFQFNSITSLSILSHFPCFLHPSYTFSDLACSIRRACIRIFAYYSFSMIN